MVSDGGGGRAGGAGNEHERAERGLSEEVGG